MKKTTTRIFSVVILILAANACLVQAKEGPQLPRRSGAYYSHTLRAEFLIQKMRIPGHVFLAARIVSPPEEGSPLHQIGLGVGDVVTRLDGVPVRDVSELDRHYGETFVRYIRQGTTRVRNGVIDLDASEETLDEEIVDPQEEMER